MIKYEDEAVLVVHKPPFLAVETRQVRQQDLVSLLRNERLRRGEEPYIGLVHRLDQPVEGLLVLGKTGQAAGKLSASLMEGSFSKDYLAVAAGETPEEGQLVHWLKKDGKSNTSVIVPPDAAGAKEARLSYERLAVITGADRQKKSLLHVRLDTGRHHQIRVQLAGIGHPLVGDAKYGGPSSQGEPLALCSVRLRFVHPVTGETMEFTTIPGGSGFLDFADTLSDIKW
jgi:23S rRNA pseudouridine1911/1915/1917 synthase